jgi:tetratricopeptide (TPR) repeat protein
MSRRRPFNRAPIAAALLIVLMTPVVRAQMGTDERVQALIGLARVKRDAGDAVAARRYFEEAARLRPLTSGERSEYLRILQTIEESQQRQQRRAHPTVTRKPVARPVARPAAPLPEQPRAQAAARASAPGSLPPDDDWLTRGIQRAVPESAFVPVALDLMRPPPPAVSIARVRADDAAPPPVIEPESAKADTAALKRRAEELSWSGEHTRAIEAYSVYLAEQPDDVNARRQQARVAGWAGRLEVAFRLYADLAARFPDSAVIGAERAAKSAFLTGRWQAAADAYREWIALEPENGEARFEFAQALRAAGHIAEADAALSELAGTSLHSMAPDAWARVQQEQRPGMALLVDTRAAVGYGGRRLLERQTEEGAFRATIGGASVDGSAGRATLRGADDSRRGYHALVHASSRISPSIELDARADVWDVWTNAHPSLEGTFQLRFRAADRWTLTGGFDRSLLFENLEVVDRRLSATGAVTGLRFDSPAAGLEIAAGWHQLSDGNQRRRSSVFYNRLVTERIRGLRALAWAEVLSFREASPFYYSPHAQIRLDVGAQYTHDFRLPQFQGDRINAVTGAYLIGADRDGVIYHHPSLRAAFELARGLAFELRADWIRSAVYNDRSVSFGVRIH